MNTLVWLANFPVSNGYAMIFIGAFSLMGLGMMTFGGGTTGDGKLQKIRAAQGLPEARSGEELRAGLRTARRILAGLLLIGMVACLALGIMGVTGRGATRAWIHGHGTAADATMVSVEGEDFVAFEAADGRTYWLHNDFFSPATWPDREAFVSSGTRFQVRYLPDHPQAYVIDTDTLPDR
ncbi:hypothetical protein DUY81_16525 [Acidipropionibacterium acidipropionici]|jgi:hypothetical protein|uniref:Uncharacterized protein n=1 Tax=Acidipropionibacterium acidipropionici TaxID=1748 RepID=A0AAC8YG18_9ACTN|nr:hypothetical protein [Acidipropionibacterium acidipropionici]AMS06023.1 hypothetical protein AXH35_11860 [Acidipropionibacterium acidipropionici]AOZ47486.1 hypothetical protein A8L58_13310 [Acidipropionibacterium acidipropionici]AZP39191.1 hypothetical protein DUY81_16525 [Acidipropionibacterium acidipropionici]